MEGAHVCWDNVRNTRPRRSPNVQRANNPFVPRPWNGWSLTVTGCRRLPSLTPRLAPGLIRGPHTQSSPNSPARRLGRELNESWTEAVRQPFHGQLRPSKEHASARSITRTGESSDVLVFRRKSGVAFSTEQWRLRVKLHQRRSLMSRSINKKKPQASPYGESESLTRRLLKPFPPAC